MFTLLALVGIALIPTPASAIIIPPGGSTGALPAGTVASSGFLATNSGTLSNGLLQNVTLRTAVYVDSGTGHLDFAYQASVGTTVTALERLTAIDFTGFVTDVYCDTAPTGSFWDHTSTIIGSTAAERTSDGSEVASEYSDGAGHGLVGTGDATCVVIIKTDADVYTSGLFQGIDGGVVQIASFSPVVPEPSSMAIAGLGALGLIGYGIRRRRGA